MPTVLPPETRGNVARTRTAGWERSHCATPWLRAKGNASAGGGSDGLASQSTPPGPSVRAFVRPLLAPFPPNSRLCMDPPPGAGGWVGTRGRPVGNGGSACPWQSNWCSHGLTLASVPGQQRPPDESARSRLRKPRHGTVEPPGSTRPAGPGTIPRSYQNPDQHGAHQPHPDQGGTDPRPG